MLYDYRGLPIDLAALSREQADVSVTGVRQPIFADMPLTSPTALADAYLAADRGDITAYLTLAEAAELRDLHYRSVLTTRRQAIAGLPIVVETTTEDARDEQIAASVRELLSKNKIATLLNDLLDGLAKGFAVSEIVWEQTSREWKPSEYLWRDQRHFCFDSDTHTKLRLLDSADLVNGVELAPYKFMVHKPQLLSGKPIKRGLARTAIFAVMIKSFGLKDWAQFADRYGMPLRVGKYSEGATAEQKSRLLQAIAQMGHDAGCIIPDSMLLDLVSAPTNANGEVFERLGSFVNKELSKVVLGQTMTADDGSSLAQSQTHDVVRKAIRDDDAQQLAMTLARDLVAPYVALNFGADSAVPTVRFDVSEPENLKMLAEALPPFIDRGLRVGAGVIRDKFGLEEPGADEEVLVGKSSVSGVAPETSAATGASNASNAGNADNASRAYSELTRRLLAGEPLTASQMLYLERSQMDDIDRKVARNSEAIETAALPAMSRIMAEVGSARNERELASKLEALQLDTQQLEALLGRLMFEAHVDGDDEGH